MAIGAPALAEKLPYDTEATRHVQEVVFGGLSADGRYVSYTVNKSPVDGASTVLATTDGRWKMTLDGNVGVAFSPDGHIAIFQRDPECLALLRLAIRKTTCLDDVESYGTHRASAMAGADGVDRLFLRRKSAPNDLVEYTLATGAERVFAGVTDYVAPEGGDSVLLQGAAGEVGGRIALRWAELSTGKTVQFWEGESPSNFKFDAALKRLAFRSVGPAGLAPSSAVYVYRAGDAAAVRVPLQQLLAANAGWAVTGIDRFTRTRNRLLVGLEPVPTTAPNASRNGVKVDVWSYRDAITQAAQLDVVRDPNSFGAEEHRYRSAAVDIRDGRTLRLADEYESIDTDPSDEWAMVSRVYSDAPGWVRGVVPPESETARSVFLLHLTTGRSTLIAAPPRGILRFSPSGRYAIFYDQHQHEYFSYETATGVRRSMTAGIDTAWTRWGEDHGETWNVYDIIGWLDGDAGVLVKDQNDLWLLDPSGRRVPRNVTKGLGRARQLRFDLALTQEGSYVQLGAHQSLLLTAFDRRTKDNGFYRVRLDRSKDPEMLTMGPYDYDVREDGGSGDAPRRAARAEAYIVFRQTESDPINLLFTTDFKSMMRLTDVHPDPKYRGLTSELVTWTLPDGKLGQGILYKPEDFDPTLRYPMIVTFYETATGGLHLFQHAGTSLGQLNIAWYISRGYLVFEPDIHYKLGRTGFSAAEAIVSGTQSLLQKPWLDAHRIGIAGHSFGGYETLFTISQSPIFAAAYAGAGPSDLISYYDSLSLVGRSNQAKFELGGQDRLGGVPWRDRAQYVENSPVMSADHITTPLLMMNNKADDAVPFTQGVEMYMALRRLSKPVWMLQYDDGDHIVGDAASGGDFTVRQQQFFDHYLKGAPPPRWLTVGIPARLKGIDTALDLDTSGAMP